MPSFSIPVSGLEASDQALSVISNNLANMNTVAYKGVTPEFSDLLYQQLGSTGAGNPIEVGLGSKVSSTSTDFTQGNIQNTGVNTDVAIEGDGFFQVDAGAVALYTRDGNLTVSPQGQLVTQDGANVMGYTATNGIVNTNGVLSPLSIDRGQISPPSATQNVQLVMNLDASATPTTPAFSTTVETYDSLGTSHLLTFNFTNTGSGAWNYNITIPAADVGSSGAPVSVKSGALTFNGVGQLTAPAGNVAGITISGLADGANAMKFNWNLYNPSGTSVVSQVAGTSEASQTTQDGFTSGTLSTFAIQSDGTIEGSFTNGQTAAIGQIALANFPNTQGLLRVGSNNFMASLASGLPTVGVPGTGGRGTLTGGGLEGSNVDIASQFSQLILQQTGYEANAKAFTTFDNVVQAVLNLVP
ncbi:MAG TPA: flagellar hook protein FlgE [Terriglobia bacterium]|nr:flagellar hook protein FlgE [Terriglobia bacterium]